MKILIVRPTPNKMDLKTYNLQEVGLAKAFVRRGHQCDVMYYCGKEKDHFQEIKFDNNTKSLRILWIHGYGIAREGIYPSLKKYVEQYDVVQVGGYIGLTSFWLNKKYPEKVVNYQGPYYYEKNKGDIRRARVFDRLLLPFLDKDKMIVGTKSILATQYVKEKGINNVTTLGVALDLDNIISSAGVKDDEFVMKLKKESEHSKFLLYIGVFEERRNIKFLMDIFKEVKNIDNSFKFIMVGDGKKEHVESCFEHAKEIGISDSIIYSNKIEQKQVENLYELSEAFILPNRYEIFGMVLLEAMYFGLPVFTTYNGGSATLINESNGVVIESNDAEVWAKKICEVLSDSDKKQEISKMASDTIKEKYTWDMLSEKFLELYKKRVPLEDENDE